MRDNPLALVRSRDEFQELATAVLALYTAVTGRAPDAPNTAPAATSEAPRRPDPHADGLSRQQRRARERARRKRR